MIIQAFEELFDDPVVRQRLIIASTDCLGTGNRLIIVEKSKVDSIPFLELTTLLIIMHHENTEFIVFSNYNKTELKQTFLFLLLTYSIKVTNLYTWARTFFFAVTLTQFIYPNFPYGLFSQKMSNGIQSILPLPIDKIMIKEIC